METSPFACNKIPCELFKKTECFLSVSEFSKRYSDLILKVHSLGCDFLVFFYFKVIVMQIVKIIKIRKNMNDFVNININF